MVAILENGSHIENNLTILISAYNFKITFYVHRSVLRNHVIWLSAVVFKVNDSILWQPMAAILEIGGHIWIDMNAYIVFASPTELSTCSNISLIPQIIFLTTRCHLRQN